MGVFWLESMSLDDVDPDQTLLNAVGGQLSELSGWSWGGGVIRQRVDLKHTLLIRVTGVGGTKAERKILR